MGDGLCEGEWIDARKKKDMKTHWPSVWVQVHENQRELVCAHCRKDF